MVLNSVEILSNVLIIYVIFLMLIKFAASMNTSIYPKHWFLNIIINLRNVMDSIKHFSPSNDHMAEKDDHVVVK